MLRFALSSGSRSESHVHTQSVIWPKHLAPRPGQRLACIPVAPGTKVHVSQPAVTTCEGLTRSSATLQHATSKTRSRAPKLLHADLVPPEKFEYAETIEDPLLLLSSQEGRQCLQLWVHTATTEGIWRRYSPLYTTHSARLFSVSKRNGRTSHCHIISLHF
jgi:hypothetical protein